MTVPTPPSALEGHCSAVHDEVLYVLSPDSFLSLPLKEGAEWSKEAQGQLVTGHACVNVVPDNDPSKALLYVIGGTTDDNNYSGLQRYSFADKTWESLSPTVGVLQGRTNHSAAYLPDSQSILVYAGSQPQFPSFLSSQTFLISTKEPYNIEAYTSEAPPTNVPILQGWNTSHAVMTGGSQDNGIYTFGPSDGWQRFGTNLTHTLDPSARGSIIDGSDGSRVLQVFEMNVSPNVVSTIPLLDANGQPAATGQMVGGSSSSRKRRRDLTLNNWPAYNSSGAPTATRSDCSVSQNTDGIAVIAAGSTDVPVALFDPSKNSWVDADKFFNSKNQQPLQPSGTSSSTSSATSVSEPSSTGLSTASSSSSSHSRTMRTLGITLGVLAGIAVFFILILLLFRLRRNNAKKANAHVDEKGDGRMSFADRGASFMKEAGGQELAPPTQNRYDVHDSRSSLAIIAGKFGGNRRNTATMNGQKQSFESTARLVRDPHGLPLVSEPMEMVNMQEKGSVDAATKSPRHSEAPPVAYHNYGANLTTGDATKGVRKRSSGWSKYFASNTPTGPNGLSHIPSVYVKPQHMSDASQYTIDRRASEISLQAPSPVAMVDGQRLSHVATGSPAFSDSRKLLTNDGNNAAIAARGQKGRIVDPNQKRRGSTGSDSRTISTDGSVLSSVLTEDYEDGGKRAWSPTRNPATNTTAPRPTSSNYTASVYYEPHQHPTRNKGNIGFFPGAGTTYRPCSKPPPPRSARPSLDGAAPPAVLPIVASEMPFARPAEDRDSTVTVFPRGMPAAYYGESENKEISATALPRQQQSSAKTDSPATQPGQSEGDMSWLNLGLNGAPRS
ncbi:Hypothetical protein R9X50_00241200 [Acrodontium crateriforme]|uniref:Pre-mRNA splicing factor CLF1 n=1 Tax=Acrodontium crateriforme TaxID=150365 RepID=A0AAQ3R8Z3_9PEZI|nr:Hypothetical protein R9X50_00241200 [Acrodontium crateriforme]